MLQVQPPWPPLDFVAHLFGQRGKASSSASSLPLSSIFSLFLTLQSLAGGVEPLTWMLDQLMKSRDCLPASSLGSFTETLLHVAETSPSMTGPLRVACFQHLSGLLVRAYSLSFWWPAVVGTLRWHCIPLWSFVDRSHSLCLSLFSPILITLPQGDDVVAASVKRMLAAEENKKSRRSKIQLAKPQLTAVR